MKKVIFSVILFSLLFAVYSFSCTSFYVASGEKFVGMNYDYPDREIILRKQVINGKNVLKLSFIENNNEMCFAGVNNAGMFANTQMFYPSSSYTASPGENDFPLENVLWACLYEVDEVNNLIEFLSENNNNLILTNSFTFHVLAGDATGNAAVFEVYNGEDHITPINDEGFIVMSNMATYTAVNQNYNQISGVGASRYVTAHSYISEHIGDFSFADAQNVLIRTKQTGSFPTQCSIIFKPEENELFLMYKRNFDKMWKINLGTMILENYQGFSEEYETEITENGLLLSTLQQLSIDSSVENKIPSLKISYPDSKTLGVDYSLEDNGSVEFGVFNVLGQKIDSKNVGLQNKGENKYLYDTSRLSNGIYFCILKTKTEKKTGRFLIVK